MEVKQSSAATVLGILATVFGGISIIPILNFIFVWPALIIGIIGLILSTVKNVKSRGAALTLNIIGLALGALSFIVYLT